MRTFLTGRLRLLPIAFSRDVGGLLADGGAALVDGGERHAQKVGVVDVADADHLDLLGNADAGFEDRLHGAGGGGIVVAEDARRGAGSS